MTPLRGAKMAVWTYIGMGNLYLPDDRYVGRAARCSCHYIMAYQHVDDVSGRVYAHNIGRGGSVRSLPVGHAAQ